MFVGHPVDGNLERALRKLDPDHVSLYLGSEGYLQEVESSGHKFWGKKVGAELDFEALSMSEAHVESLLRKLLPDYHFKELLLFPIADE